MSAAKTLLTIDDETGLRHGIRDYFEDSGYTVFEAENGKVGIAVFREERPDVVLVDLRMPEVDGLEVVRTIHQEAPEVPLVIVSGTGLLDDAIEAIREGAWDYVTKPIADMKALEHVVDRVLERARLLEENKRYQEELESQVAQRTIELRAANLDLGQTNKRLRSIVEIIHRLQGFDRTKSFGTFLLDQFAEHMQAAGGSLYLCEGDGMRLVKSLDPGHAPAYIPLPLSDGTIMQQAFLSDRVLLVEEVEQESGLLASGWSGYGDGSCLIFPLVDRAGEKVGVLSLHRKKSPPFLEQDKQVGLILTSYASEAIRAIYFLEQVKEREKAFKALAKGVAGSGEQNVQVALVKACAAIFKVESALVGVLTDKGLVETSAIMIEDCIVPNLSFDPKDTPCGEVLDGGECLYPDHVRQKFPGVKHLEEHHLEGYVGTPLVGRTGENVGVLCVFSQHPIILPGHAHEVLNIIAAKAASVIEQQLADQEQQKLQGNLRQSQKMEAVGTLAGGIAHDFNNILSAILGYSEIAFDDVEPGSRAQQDIREVLKAGNRAKDLVRHILTFSRRSERERIPLEIHPVVKEAIKLLRASIPTSVEIKHYVDVNCGAILADPTQIHQVLMNLCTNSSFAMEQTGGVLEVRLELQTLTATDLEDEPSLPAGPYLRLLVSDTGVGIEPDILDRIFEPYFTTKDIDKGLGMGLAVVHGIVKSHNGIIRVASQVGKGTTFQIYLPQIRGIAQELPPESESLVGGKERILVVDDESNVVEITRRRLEGLGYAVEWTTSSLEALELFCSNPQAFDLVITDQTMPKMTGDQLVKELLAIRPDIPVILCTGYHTKLLGMDEIDGVEKIIKKPYTANELIYNIIHILQNP